MKVKILGVDNSTRKDLEKRVQIVLKELSVKADVQIVAKVDEILQHDISGIPALMVNGKIVSQRIVPDVAKVKSYFYRA